VVRQLFRLIDWMMALPPEFEQQFHNDLVLFEEGRHMPYVTSVERLAREEGRQEGRQEGLWEGLLEGIQLDLELRFGRMSKKPLAKPRTLDLAQLRALARVVKSAESLDAVKSQLP
jgi:hypothetical protein